MVDIVRALSSAILKYEIASSYESFVTSQQLFFQIAKQRPLLN